MLTRTRIELSALIALLISSVSSISVIGAETQLTPGTKLVFADQSEGQVALKHVDDFIKRLSPFDRSARLKTDRSVSQDEFLHFIAEQVQPWTADEIKKLTSINQSVAAKLAPFNLPFPPLVTLIKTSGMEEGKAAYCRGNCIILPVNNIEADQATLERTVIHELFHILSRNNVAMRDALYASIGFKTCNEIECPHELADRKITNPDAPIVADYIEVKPAEKTVKVVPILFSRQPKYDMNKGGEFFDYLVFELMVVNEQNHRWSPARVDGHLQLMDQNHAHGYAEQIGANTGYTIHPEEVLADNFVMFVNQEKGMASPKIVSGIADILVRYKRKP